MKLRDFINQYILFGGVRLSKGTSDGELAEFTFLRKNRVSLRLAVTDYPHPLDCANLTSRKNHVLPRSWREEEWVIIFNKFPKLSSPIR